MRHLSTPQSLALNALYDAGKPCSARQLHVSVITMRTLGKRGYVGCTGGSGWDAVWAMTAQGTTFIETWRKDPQEGKADG